MDRRDAGRDIQIPHALVILDRTLGKRLELAAAIGDDHLFIGAEILDQRTAGIAEGIGGSVLSRQGNGAVGSEVFDLIAGAEMMQRGGVGFVEPLGLIAVLAVAVHTVIVTARGGVAVKNKALLDIAVIGDHIVIIVLHGGSLRLALACSAVHGDLILFRDPLRGQFHIAVTHGGGDGFFILIEDIVVHILFIEPLDLVGAVFAADILAVTGALGAPSAEEITVSGKAAFTQLGALAVHDGGALHLTLALTGIIADMIRDPARRVEADPVQGVAVVIQRGIEGVADMEDVLHLVGIIHRDIGDMVALIVIDDQQIVTAALDKVNVVVITVTALTGIAGVDAVKLLDDLKIRVEQSKVICTGQADDIAVAARVIGDRIDILVDLDVLDRR